MAPRRLSTPPVPLLWHQWSQIEMSDWLEAYSQKEPPDLTLEFNVAGSLRLIGFHKSVLCAQQSDAFRKHLQLDQATRTDFKKVIVKGDIFAWIVLLGVLYEDLLPYDRQWSITPGWRNNPTPVLHVQRLCEAFRLASSLDLPKAAAKLGDYAVDTFIVSLGNAWMPWMPDLVTLVEIACKDRRTARLLPILLEKNADAEIASWLKLRQFSPSKAEEILTNSIMWGTLSLSAADRETLGPDGFYKLVEMHSCLNRKWRQALTRELKRQDQERAQTVAGASATSNIQQ